MTDKNKIKSIDDLFDYSLLKDYIKAYDTFPLGMPMQVVFDSSKDKESFQNLKNYFLYDFLKTVSSCINHSTPEMLCDALIVLNVDENLKGNFYFDEDVLLKVILNAFSGEEINEELIKKHGSVKESFRFLMNRLKNLIEKTLREQKTSYNEESPFSYRATMTAFLKKKYKIYLSICENAKKSPVSEDLFLNMFLEDCKLMLSQIDKICEQIKNPINMEVLNENISFNKLYLNIGSLIVNECESFNILLWPFLLNIVNHYENIITKDDSDEISSLSFVRIENNKKKFWSAEKFIKEYKSLLARNEDVRHIVDRLNHKKTYKDYYPNITSFAVDSTDYSVPYMINSDQLFSSFYESSIEDISNYIFKNFIKPIFEGLPYLEKEMNDAITYTVTTSKITLNPLVVLMDIYGSFTGEDLDYDNIDYLYEAENIDELKDLFITKLKKFKDILLDYLNGNDKIKEEYPVFYEGFQKNKNKKGLISIITGEIDEIINRLDKIIEFSSKPIDLEKLNSVYNPDKYTVSYIYYVISSFDETYDYYKNYEPYKEDFLAKVELLKNWYTNTLEILKDNKTYNPTGEYCTEDGILKTITMEELIDLFKKIAKKYEGKLSLPLIEEIPNEIVSEFFENPNNPEFAPDEFLNIDNYIPSISELFLPEVIVKGKNIGICELNKHSNDDKLLYYLKHNYFIDILNRIPNIPDSLLNSCSLSFDIEKNLDINLSISFESILRMFTNYITGEYLSPSDCNNLEEYKDKFIDKITTYGDLLARVLDNVATEEEHNKVREELERINKIRVNQIPFNEKEYLNYAIDLILTLCDSIDEIKKACNVTIKPDEIDNLINNDTFYLEEAFKLFVSYKDAIKENKKVKKEEYLVLAKYINAVKRIKERKNYDTVISSYEFTSLGYESVSASLLLEEYQKLLSANSDYDLEKAPLYNILTNRDKAQTLVANWNILPKGHIKRLKDTKVDSKPRVKEKKAATFSEEYEKVTKRKAFLDNTDCIVIDGVNRFKGYVGYYYPNGLVFFEIFFEDGNELKPKTGATYIMNIENFVEMSALSIPEVMEYIKDGGTDVRRINHTSTWQDRVLDAIDGKLYTEVIKDIISKKIDKNIEDKKELQNGQTI